MTPIVRQRQRLSKRIFYSIRAPFKQMLYGSSVYTKQYCVGFGLMRRNRKVMLKKIIRLLFKYSRPRFDFDSKVKSNVFIFLTRLIGLNQRFRRALFGLPINGQRTRSNSRTMAKRRIKEMVTITSRLLGVQQTRVGAVRGKEQKSKKIKAKLKASAPRTKTKITKKKPVIRSRDTKKSV